MMIRALALLVPLTASLAARGDEGPISFRDRVAPVLVRRCLACHGPSKAFAGYRVDTYARLMADSAAGKLIEPGRPDSSLFLDLLTLTEPTGRMPKGSDPLPEGEVQALRRWIEQGAKAGGVDPDADLSKLVPGPK